MAGVEHLALLERPLYGVLQVLERVLVPLAEAHVLVLESALQEEIRESLQQIFGAEAEVVTGVFGIADPLHNFFLGHGWTRINTDNDSLKSVCIRVYPWLISVKLPARRPRSTFLPLARCRLPLALASREANFLVAADAPMRIEAFQDELGR